ncbi:Na+/H+ antiporter subunit A [Microlunatus aurantiacus]|uniref:Na+/H+ antiporter subunit A n=1 Tax=Microlunatus aurantiacus TaxID=446786 RepID=A0ABP7CNN0_9ACTN
MTFLIAVHFAVACCAPLLVRVLRARAFFVLAAVPAAAFGWLVAQAPVIVPGGYLTERVPWIPTLGVDLAYHIGTLQWVLALLVTGVGALVLFYCRWYFSGADVPARTGGLLVAFAGAMLGLVTADDLILLYVFWELTTVFSYLLVGHNPTRGANRRAALTALMVTTFGGLAMLVGIVMIGVTAGTFSLSAVLAQPDRLGTGTVAVVAVLLLLVGALTKSAQVPFHFWLPGAMAAPTPVSAYLHAAAMVKAGVYLVALLAPVFADLPGWRPLVLTLGAVTMILGAWRALRQYDIKLLLAYGTVSQLGFLMAMCGLGTRSAMVAGVAMVISHALFKAALFLVVGVVDRSTGTRDIRKLSGVARELPLVAGAAAVAAASMAAVPPLIGFTAKEAAFESLVYLLPDGDQTGIAPLPAVLLMTALVAGSALTVAYTLRFLWGAFGTKPGVLPTAVDREPFGFGLAPLVLAAASLVGGFVGPSLTELLDPLAETAEVGEPSHGIALWHGFTAPLALSALALGVGVLLFVRRRWIGRVQATFPQTQEAEEVYQALMRGIDRSAVEVTARTQRGSLPIYLGTIMLVLVVLPGSVLLTLPAWPSSLRPWDTPGQVLVGATMIVAAVLAASSRGRLKAVILVGVTGYGTALMFLLHGAPDLALTQVLVETVTLVVFVLVLRKLPKYFTDRPLHSSRWWRLVIALLVGFTVVSTVYLAAGARVATPVSEAFYEAAYTFGYGKNIVNVTLVDIRSWDTLGEISVLVVAATGVASLIFIRRRYTELEPPRGAGRPRRRSFRRPESAPANSTQGRMTWLRGTEQLSPIKRSIIFEVVTRLLFPVMILTSLFFLFSGHNNPGGGFAGGLIAGLALTIRYLAGGRHELDEAAPVDAGRVLGAGLLTAGLSSLAPVLVGGRIGQSFDVVINAPYLSYLPTPGGTVTLLGEIHFVTSVVFDIGVYLVVIGVMLDLARSLGSGIDQHEEEDRTPSPQISGPRARAAALRAGIR